MSAEKLGIPKQEEEYIPYFDGYNMLCSFCVSSSWLFASLHSFLLTIPPSVGYEQNPLSLYYCYDSEGCTVNLKKCIAEVCNCNYFLPFIFLHMVRHVKFTAQTSKSSVVTIIFSQEKSSIRLFATKLLDACATHSLWFSRLGCQSLRDMSKQSIAISSKVGL